MGGVDSNKFIGPLQTFSVQPTGLGNYTNPFITLADVRLVYDGQNSSLTNGSSIQILPDPGETVSYLPQDYFDALVYAVTGSKSGINCPTNRAGISTCFEEGVQTCSCSLLDNSTTLDFVFDSEHGPVAFELPMGEIIYSTSDICYFGFLPTNDSEAYILGSNFVRATYVVYDFLHNEVSMAPTNNKPSSSNVQVIPSAGVVAAAFQGVSPSSTATHTASHTAPAATNSTVVHSSSSGLSTGAKAGIGVGAALGGLLLLALGAWLVLRRRRQTRSAAATQVDPNAPTLQPSEKHQIDGRVVSSDITSYPTSAINSERQEMAATEQEPQHGHGQRPLSDLSTSDQHTSTAMGSVKSAGHEQSVHELGTGGNMLSSSVRRKPVGSS